jgi:hypothetical protein
LSTFFNKTNNKKNGNPFSFNNNTESPRSSNFQTQQSNGYDNTDRPMGYQPRLIPINQPTHQPTPTLNSSPQQNPNPQEAPNPRQSSPPPNDFSFQKPSGPQYSQPNPVTPNNLPVGYEQEFFTYQYPTTGEIVKDLGLRVFEVVVGAAAVAAGQEVARFFSRRRFNPAIPQHDMYQQNYPNNYGQHNPNNNIWKK